MARSVHGARCVCRSRAQLSHDELVQLARDNVFAGVDDEHMHGVIGASL